VESAELVVAAGSAAEPAAPAATLENLYPLRRLRRHRPPRLARRRITFPESRGTYLLWCVSTARRRVRVGRLGWLRLDKGSYLYAGSALGPGGLRSRIDHHLRPALRLHWHVDYLRRHTRLAGVFFRTGDTRLEHDWASLLGTLPGASSPLPGFGSSDCTCGSHLFHLREAPAPERLIALLSAEFVDTAK
jgi:Uri superfamily endonuclease